MIYPGKFTKADCFRIGTIGRLFPEDMANLLSVFEQILRDMGVSFPVTPIQVE